MKLVNRHVTKEYLPLSFLDYLHAMDVGGGDVHVFLIDKKYYSVSIDTRVLEEIKRGPKSGNYWQSWEKLLSAEFVEFVSNDIYELQQDETELYFDLNLEIQKKKLIALLADTYLPYLRKEIPQDQPLSSEVWRELVKFEGLEDYEGGKRSGKELIHDLINTIERYGTFRTDLNRSITTEQEAKQFIRDLYINGEFFHFDDNISDILFYRKPSEEQVRQLERLVDEIFQVLEDPYLSPESL